jgi:hypothetical protein
MFETKLYYSYLIYSTKVNKTMAAFMAAAKAMKANKN